MYYPCSKNKGADQLCIYREADLRLCFRICGLLVFLLMTNGLAYHYHLGVSTIILRVIRSDLKYLFFFSLKQNRLSKHNNPRLDTAFCSITSRDIWDANTP